MCHLFLDRLIYVSVMPCSIEELAQLHVDCENAYSNLAEIFIKWDGLWCPCCNHRLRTKPRDIHYREKLRARREIAKYQSSFQQQER
jgi:hypothetical protein